MAASYRRGIEYIALNDEPREMDESNMSGYASVHVLAEVFQKDEKDVARDVVRYRVKQAKEEARADKGSAKMEQAHIKQMQDECLHLLEETNTRIDGVLFKYQCVKCGKHLKILNGVLKQK
jgi:hypothetical protein